MRAAKRWLPMVLLAVVGMSACDTQDLLKVELPGNVLEDYLTEPTTATLLTNSVISEVECAWSNYVTASSHQGDEWYSSSANTVMRRWGVRDIKPDFAPYATGTCEDNYGLFTPLHEARVMANVNYDKINAFSDAAVPNKKTLLATIKAYSGYVFVAFGEGFCGTPLDGKDPALTPKQLQEAGLVRFNEAVTLAEGTASLANILNLALVGRARLKLDLNDYAGAIKDAERVPAGFLFVATRDATSARRQNPFFRLINGLPSSPSSQRHGTISPSFRNVTWKGVKDPRVVATTDGVSVGFDFTTVSWRTPKYNSYADPINMASYREAQMIIAEAAALSGDLPRAIAIMNQFHTTAGIPGVTAADYPTQDDVIRGVIEEDRREFFVESGHRFRQMLRWRGTKFNIPFKGEAGSDFPSGKDPTGVSFEPITCFPNSAFEVG